MNLSNMDTELSDKVRALPDSPGVYLMRGRDGEPIYIGKAHALKKRVSSHFSRTDKTPKQAALLRQITDIDFIVTASEAEALILEAGLIKEYRPKYNVAIKDDKAYPLLKLTVKEKYPRLLIARRRKSDGNLYFGPYTSGKLLRQAVIFLREIFPLRSCRNLGKSLCLNYHLKLCAGPCAAKIDKTAYSIMVRHLKLFLEGRKQELIKKLSAEMERESKNGNFEKAIILRDQIAGLGMLGVSRASFNRGFKLRFQAEELQQALRLKNPPVTIEGFDVSNLFGEEAVGAMVRFKNGQPEKSGYRRFKIRTIAGIDDYAMLKEIISRRYGASLKEELGLPDLILIDGGRGHLECICSQLEKMGVDLPVVSIAKQFEYVYVRWQDKPLILQRNAKALHLLMRVRDEAHRFALSFHKMLRKKEMFFSELDLIPGIGKKRKKILMENMESLVKFKRMSLKKILSIKGMDKKTAKNVIEYWKKH